jgi:hypothetical protein
MWLGALRLATPREPRILLGRKYDLVTQSNYSSTSEAKTSTYILHVMLEVRRSCLKENGNWERGGYKHVTQYRQAT